MRRSQARHELRKDLFLIFIGIMIAWFLNRTGVIDYLISLIGNSAVSSFVSGIFFTSIFSIGPASIALVHIAEQGSVRDVVLWGALGAAFGDVILFFFIRDHFADHIVKSLKPSHIKHILASFHLGFMKWLSPVLGALIIASPLPDEFGMALLGMSNIRIALLIPIAFVMNLLGISLLLWFT
jgi:hypothetical protein